MDPPPAPSDTRLSWYEVIATPESRAQNRADLNRISDFQERTEAYDGMFALQARAPIPEAPPQTETAPSPTEGGWPTEDWAAQGDWPTEDWATQGDWPSEDWPTQGSW